PTTPGTTISGRRSILSPPPSIARSPASSHNSRKPLLNDMATPNTSASCTHRAVTGASTAARLPPAETPAPARPSEAHGRRHALQVRPGHDTEERQPGYATDPRATDPLQDSPGATARSAAGGTSRTMNSSSTSVTMAT